MNRPQTCGNLTDVTSSPSAFMQSLIDLAIAAGAEIMTIYASDFSARAKGDLTPVTEADEAAEKIILAGLARIAPQVPVISEEAAAAGVIPAVAERFFLVDPLDGTREFVKGGPEFTVNIALIYKGEPIMGVVYAPVKGELYAAHEALGAFRWLEDTDNQKEIRVRKVPRGGHTVFISKNRDYGTKLDHFLNDYKVEKIIKKSSSLKICMIAAGKGDLYPGFGETCEWDLAAGHAVLKIAGGDIQDFNGKTLTYGHQDRKFINPDFLAASEFHSKE